MAIPLQRIVAFDAGHLLERGTDVALYDYALGNEEILGNRSWILCPSRADVSALDKALLACDELTTSSAHASRCSCGAIVATSKNCCGRSISTTRSTTVRALR